jgi:hypothetical protein
VEDQTTELKNDLFTSVATFLKKTSVAIVPS